MGRGPKGLHKPIAGVGSTSARGRNQVYLQVTGGCGRNILDLNARWRVTKWSLVT